MTYLEKDSKVRVLATHYDNVNGGRCKQYGLVGVVETIYGQTTAVRFRLEDNPDHAGFYEHSNSYYRQDLEPLGGPW